MITFITRRYSALLAAAFLACAVLGFTKEGLAQPPPPCKTCLQAFDDKDSCLCQGPPDSICIGCHTWVLVNTCDSCLTAISINSKGGPPFTTCCVVVQEPTHETWTVDSISPGWVIYRAPTGSCLSNSPGHNQLQITTCGLTTGDHAYLSWAPGQGGGPTPPCDTTGGDQDVLITVP